MACDDAEWNAFLGGDVMEQLAIVLGQVFGVRLEQTVTLAGAVCAEGIAEVCLPDSGHGGHDVPGRAQAARGLILREKPGESPYRTRHRRKTALSDLIWPAAMQSS